MGVSVFVLIGLSDLAGRRLSGRRRWCYSYTHQPMLYGAETMTLESIREKHDR